MYITVQVWSSWMPGMESLSQTPARSRRKQRSSTSLCLCSAWLRTPNSSSLSPLRWACVCVFTCQCVHLIIYVYGKPVKSLFISFSLLFLNIYIQYVYMYRYHQLAFTNVPLQMAVTFVNATLCACTYVPTAAYSLVCISERHPVLLQWRCALV